MISPLRPEDSTTLPEDAPGLARTIMTAFYQDPLWVALWPEKMSLQEIVSDCAVRLPWNVVQTVNSGKRFQKAIDSSTGQITSNDIWKEAVPPTVAQEQRDACEERFKSATEDGQIRYDRDMEADLSQLDYLAVHPNYQRYGIGRLLLREGLAVADHLGLKTFIIAKEAGVKLYHAHGFREVDRVTQLRRMDGVGHM
ncbi:hypothetical protein CERZMDRAFT_112860 [Cercospora zeae-maydis SCOH1-5]|uniref:N-acetyltransferase domain-containing protein n=1 Tax=Cercospora zeae-maydis SCOH1-5 TaxID=717836 RepID=A0A6A6FCD0_9PEZI|nr:hypothetical protein CERZMDRAFT_112860 [Cercospora zeae-maydis SCOH1-5]